MNPRNIDRETYSECGSFVTLHFDDGSSRKLARIMGGDHTHPLNATLERVSGELKEAKQEHAEKHRAHVALMEEVGKSEEAIDTDHPKFKAMDDAGKDVDAAAGRIGKLEETKDGLVAQLKRAGVAVPATDPEGRGQSEETRVETAKAIAEALRGIQSKSAGERITDSDEWKALRDSGVLQGGQGSKRRVGDVPLGQGWTRDEVKALITGASPSSAGAFVTPDRIGYYPLPQRPLTVLDLITVGDTDSDLVEFVRMLSYTNAAAEVAEAISAAPITPRDGSAVTAVQGGRKPESAMDFEVIDTAVKTIAHWVPATKRSLADAGQMRTIIDGLLRWGLDERLERQIVAGSGAGENLTGILNTTGTNSVPAGPRPIQDKVHFGLTQCRIDGFEPTGVLLNPLDEETLRLTRTEEGGAGTGSYLFGNPNSPGPMTLWGKPVATSASVPQGTGIVGAFAAAILWMREGAQVVASDSHEDFFTRNLVAILAELRAAFGIPMPQAFSEVNFAAA